MGKIYEYGTKTGKIQWENIDRDLIPIGTAPELDQQLHNERRTALYSRESENVLKTIGDDEIAECIYLARKKLSALFEKEKVCVEEVLSCDSLLKQFEQQLNNLLESERFGFLSLSKDQYDQLSALYNDVLNSMDDISAHYEALEREQKESTKRQELDDYINGLETLLEPEEEEYNLEHKQDEEYEMEL